MKMKLKLCLALLLLCLSAVAANAQDYNIFTLRGRVISVRVYYYDSGAVHSREVDIISGIGASTEYLTFSCLISDTNCSLNLAASCPHQDNVIYIESNGPGYPDYYHQRSCDYHTYGSCIYARGSLYDSPYYEFLGAMASLTQIQATSMCSPR